MDKRGADVDDVMEVLLAAEQLATTDHHPDRWRVTGTDLSGDRLSVVVQVQWLDDVAVVTVFWMRQGTTKETVSRWENGKHAIDRPAFAVLATLVVDTSKGRRTTLRRRLETMSTEPAPPPGPVRLEVAA